MPVETFNHIDSLVTTNPTATDNVSEGDDHIRGIKTTLKNTFPNVTGAVTPTQTELNYVDGVTSAIQTQIDGKQATLGAGDITATEIASNAVGADEINVTGNGTAGQYLASDGDGTMTWTTLDTDPAVGGDLTGTISNAQIGANAVGAAEIADNTVSAAELNVTGNGTAGQALLSDGDGSMSWGAAGGTTGGQAFVSSGNYQVAVPSDATHALLFGVGGGGAGGSDQGASKISGGDGGRVIGAAAPVTGGQNIAITVGTAGNSASNQYGNSGNATTFQGAGLTVSVGGGTGGQHQYAGGGGGNVSGVNPGITGASGSLGTGTNQNPASATYGNYGKGAKQGATGGCAWISFIKDV